VRRSHSSESRAGAGDATRSGADRGMSGR
jgi:hypothetical protein